MQQLRFINNSSQLNILWEII